MPPATMNWKRGLLRLWAVAAVLWVGVAFYLAQAISSLDTYQRVRDEHDPYAAFSSPVAPRDLLADAPSPPAPPLPSVDDILGPAPSAAAPQKPRI